MDVQLVGTQATSGVFLAGEVECQGAGSEVGGRAERLVDEALAAGETCRGGAEGAGAAVQYLRDVAATAVSTGWYGAAMGGIAW